MSNRITTIDNKALTVSTDLGSISLHVQLDADSSNGHFVSMELTTDQALELIEKLRRTITAIQTGRSYF